MNDQQLQIIELSKNPLNYGKLEKADIIKLGKNLSCGDQCSVYLRRAPSDSSSSSDRGREVIEEMKFEAQGCSISIASASLLSEYIKGKTDEEIIALTSDNLQQIIGMELGPSRLKCALLPLDTIQQGIKEDERK